MDPNNTAMLKKGLFWKIKKVTKNFMILTQKERAQLILDLKVLMKVLFVCSGNAYRSPLAEALLKKLKPEIEVDSAGINPPLIPISKAARKFLAKENAEQYLKEVPEVLDSKQLDEYDLIIAMEPRHKVVVLTKCPECENRIVVWNIHDPYFSPNEYTEKIFEQIKQKVKELANSL